MNIIYTIGHSNKDINSFIDILNYYNIDLLVDVRSLPGSNKFPWFNKENLEKVLKVKKIKYVHLKKLGGYKSKNNIEDTTNSYWQNKSFRNYANYALSNEFTEGLNELINLSKNNTLAIMCSEALWWRCHRRIIVDYLIINKIKVFHILGLKKMQSAELNEHSKIVEDKIDYT